MEIHPFWNESDERPQLQFVIEFGWKFSILSPFFQKSKSPPEVPATGVFITFGKFFIFMVIFVGALLEFVDYIVYICLLSHC